MYSVKSFCGALSLKWGSVTIMSVHLVCSLLELIFGCTSKYGKMTFFFLFFLTLIVCILGLFGAIRKIHICMIPFMIYLFFGFLIWVCILALLLLEQIGINVVLKYLSQSIDKNLLKIVKDFNDGFFYLAWLFLVLSVFQHYSLMVIQSYFRKIQRENEDGS